MRRIMSGYRFLKATHSLNMIRNINQAFTNHHLNIKQEHFSKYIFGSGVEQAEIISRQYLLLRCAGLNFNKALLHTLGKKDSLMAHYLPADWRAIIGKQGVPIAWIRTIVLWNVFIIIMLLYGYMIVVRIIGYSLYASLRKLSCSLGRYVYFNELTAGNLPNPGIDGRSHDIITWYMQWNERNHNIDTLCHGIKNAESSSVNGTPVFSVSTIIPPLKRFGSLVSFLIWGIGASLFATFDVVRGRWWHALLLNQAALAAQVRFQDPTQLAKDYMFHNSGWFFRPLWTYEAERHGARIIFYFYSTNCEAFKQPGGYPPIPYGWQAMNWPQYLVWDEYQANFVRRAVGDAANINIVGPIWFHTSSEEMPAFSGKGVAVFDVTPHRSSRYQTLGAESEFYVPETCVPFLYDIQQITEGAGYRMLWKRKRKIGSVAHPKYRLFAERLSKAENVIIVDPDISAYRVIEECELVISMPFTSTALIARELGKRSCYYDPSGLIQKDDRAAHGIEIIHGSEELSAWLTI